MFTATTQLGTGLAEQGRTALALACAATRANLTGTPVTFAQGSDCGSNRISDRGQTQQPEQPKNQINPAASITQQRKEREQKP